MELRLRGVEVLQSRILEIHQLAAGPEKDRTRQHSALTHHGPQPGAPQVGFGHDAAEEIRAENAGGVHLCAVEDTLGEGRPVETGSDQAGVLEHASVHANGRVFLNVLPHALITLDLRAGGREEEIWGKGERVHSFREDVLLLLTAGEEELPEIRTVHLGFQGRKPAGKRLGRSVEPQNNSR